MINEIAYLKVTITNAISWEPRPARVIEKKTILHARLT